MEIIGIFLLVLVAFGVLTGIGLNTQEQRLTEPELGPLAIKTLADSSVSYDDLMRNNENYVDKIVNYEGKIIEATNIFSDTYVLLIGLDKPYYFDDIVYVNYAGPRVLEDDIVEFWGKVIGIKEYTAVLGNTIAIPEIDSMILEVIKKQG